MSQTREREPGGQSITGVGNRLGLLQVRAGEGQRVAVTEGEEETDTSRRTNGLKQTQSRCKNGVGESREDGVQASCLEEGARVESGQMG